MKDKDGGKEGVTAMPRGGGREERGIQRSGRWEQEGKLGTPRVPHTHTHTQSPLYPPASLQRAADSSSHQPLRTVTSAPFYRRGSRGPQGHQLRHSWGACGFVRL